VVVVVVVVVAVLIAPVTEYGWSAWTDKVQQALHDGEIDATTGALPSLRAASVRAMASSPALAGGEPGGDARQVRR
jgi:hypothetical protein